MRKVIIAGNWKMNKTISEAIELANGLKRQLLDISTVDIVICPVFTALSEVAEVIMDTNIQLGAQDMYWEQNGAFTGEVSGQMLKDVGCKFVIIGHSERRQYFAETDESVNKKIKAALNIGLIPIVCVGENLDQREKNETFNIVATQIKKCFDAISIQEATKIIIAYEPIWAIGTGRTATPDQAQEVHAFIRNLLVQLYGQDIAGQVRIQYGGSVKPENISDLIRQKDIDGALVGGASLKIDSFSNIVKNCLVEVK
jgi:triosephosphate isomerase